MNYLFPILISFIIGWMGARLLLHRAPPPSALLAFLGGTLGLGFSGLVTALSIMLIGRLIPSIVWTIHAATVASLTFIYLRTFGPGNRWSLQDIKRSDIAGVILLALLIVPVAIYASIYPQGGWDAWSCWNLKARFLFLGGEHWPRMLDPVLWRSNIAYPFLIPAINTWIWTFGQAPIASVPMGLSCLITFLTAGTLLFTLKKYSGRLHSLLAPLWFLSIMFIIILSSSQYSDLAVGLYLLTFLSSLLFFRKTGNAGWLPVAACALGTLAFTKSEGLVLTLICLPVMGLLLFRKFRNTPRLPAVALGTAVTLMLALMPAIIFQKNFCPDSHTFINGLSSAAKPTSLDRLKAVGMFAGLELISPKWNGFWLIAIGGLFLAGLRSFRREIVFIPLILAVYLLCVAGVYWINTFFEIIWWLGSTLNRILYALVPTMILWVFLALEKNEPAPKKK